jgi:hypothetical protein
VTTEIQPGGGSKARGLIQMAELGIAIPPTRVSSDLDGAIAFLGDAENWSTTRCWIIRSSPDIDPTLDPAVSGLYPSAVVHSPADVEEVIDGLRQDLESRAISERLAWAGITTPRVAFLIQPYLCPRISGIAHIPLSGDIHISWVEGHLSTIAGGFRSGNSLYFQGTPNILLSYGPSGERSLVSHHRVPLVRAALALNLLRKVPGPREVEWLVTPELIFYGLQIQLIPEEN